MSPPRQINWLLILGAWTALGALLAIQTYISVVRTPDTLQEHGLVWLAQLYRVWLWALLTPFIFMLRRELLRRHRNVILLFGFHLLAAISLLAWCNIVRIWMLNLTYGVFEWERFGLDAVLRLVGPRSLIDFYLYWVVLAAGYMVDLNAEKRRTELREEQLQTQLAQAELAALKQQVQPHFLFNSLNAISALMREGHSGRAVEAIALLSTLLRQLMANGGRQEIELARELDYAQVYLAVEKFRFEERLQIDIDAEENCLEALVPTLLLQPLVENAVKHGIAQRRNPGRVRVTARRVGDQLRIEVFNDPAEGGRRASEQDNHGIGLQATRARLEHAFAGRHRLECELDREDGSLVRIEIPFNLRTLPAGVTA